MIESNNTSAPVSWQVTATTIQCAMVADYVTIMVYKDWSSKCTWWAKYRKLDSVKHSRQLGKSIKEGIMRCQGPECKYITDYRNRLIEEEKKISFKS